MRRCALLWLACAFCLPASAAGQVSATQGVAIGGNVTNSSVTVGISAKGAQALVESASRNWKNLTDAQRKELGALKAQLGITEGALRTFFTVLGEKNIAEDMLPERLGEIAGQYLALRAQLQANPTEPSETAKLKDQARVALEAGRLTEADYVLQKIEALQEAALATQLKERVETSVQRATLALSQLRYRDAATQLGTAARYASSDGDKMTYQQAQVRLLLNQANEFDDSAAQGEAVALLRDRLARTEEASDARAWAEARETLAAALVSRGEGKATDAQQNEAVQLLEQARAGRYATQDRAYAARLNYNYGSLLCDLGGIRQDQGLRQKGAAALTDTISRRAEPGVADVAARASINLSNCVAEQGSRSYDKDATLSLRQQFIAEARGIDRAVNPAAWAAAQASAGTMDIMLGLNEKSADYFADGAARFRAALTVQTPTASPDSWRSSATSLVVSLRGLHDYWLSVAPQEEALDLLGFMLTQLKASPAKDRIGLQTAQFEMRTDLGRALDDPDMVRRALADLRQSGMSSADIEADDRAEFDRIKAEAEAWLAKGLPPTPAPDDETIISLIQITLDLTGKNEADTNRALMSFAEKLKANTRCLDGYAIASALGATTVANDRVKAGDLPQALRGLAAMKIGSASPVFGAPPTVHALILCGRTTKTAVSPAP